MGGHWLPPSVASRGLSDRGPLGRRGSRRCSSYDPRNALSSEASREARTGVYAGHARSAWVPRQRRGTRAGLSEARSPFAALGLCAAFFSGRILARDLCAFFLHFLPPAVAISSREWVAILFLRRNFCAFCFVFSCLSNSPAYL